MAVNGIEIRKGQQWVDGFGAIVEMAEELEHGEYQWISTDGVSYTRDGIYDIDYPFTKSNLAMLHREAPGVVGDDHQEVTFHALPVVDAMTDADRAHASAAEKFERSMFEMLNGGATAAAGIGDINSDAKGSGARYNAGKTPFELIPLRQLGTSFLFNGGLSDEGEAAARALQYLGDYQSRARGVDALYDAMLALGLDGGWAECAQVFEYGKRKYAEWNWAKGMKWSVPIACAARHCLAIIGGELRDLDKPGAPGSQLPHRGHVFCNLVMLIAYAITFQEGDDRPAAGLLAPMPASNDNSMEQAA